MSSCIQYISFCCYSNFSQLHLCLHVFSTYNFVAILTSANFIYVFMYSVHIILLLFQLHPASFTSSCIQYISFCCYSNFSQLHLCLHVFSTYHFVAILTSANFIYVFMYSVHIILLLF